MDLVALASVRKEQNGLSALGLRTLGTEWTLGPFLTYVRNKMDLVPLAYVRKEQNGRSALGLRTFGTEWT